METRQIYMRRAIELARHGALDASPNPMVGAVIADPDGHIIGEGWHRRCGEGHAEVNAIASVKDKSRLRDSTMYVTLEPCSHYGKTPPCAELIIRMGIPRVVIGCKDPFAKVSGRGIAMLREAGVEVAAGMLEGECRKLNEKFMTAHTQGRPFITLKWAESADRYMDAAISNPLSAMEVHRERALHDGILVGSGTWIADRPRLDTRLYAGKSPRRVVLDRRRRLADLPEDVIHITGACTLAETVARLYTEHGMTSLLVEGGAMLLESFLEERLFDRIRVERSPHPVHGKVKAPLLPPAIMAESLRNIDGNTVTTYVRQ